jgi:hypothetical protein
VILYIIVVNITRPKICGVILIHSSIVQYGQLYVVDGKLNAFYGTYHWREMRRERQL